MANKYIIHGATFNGDGTSSAEAASDGAAGAWNNINVFEGTAPAFGSLAAGDTVYIRSKDASGADITRTLSATVNIGSTAATAAAPIVWVIDGGSVWSGIDGVITYECPSTYIFAMRADNHVWCETQDSLTIYEANAAANSKNTLQVTAGTWIRGAFVDGTLAANASTGYRIATDSGITGRVATLENVRIKFGNYPSHFLYTNQYGTLRLINCELEKLTAAETDGIFSASIAGRIEVIGGRLHGTGATTGARLTNLAGSGMQISIVGMTIPKAVSPLTAAPTGTGATGRIEMLGTDGGVGSAIGCAWGEADSRDDGFYPTLNAVLPDSVSTPWSWKVYPFGASENQPAQVTSAKLFTETADARTITLEVLIASVFSPTTRNTWMDLLYMDDSTGEMRHVSTRAIPGATLAASVAGWSATTYGATALSKYKLEATTPTNIRQDSLVYVSFYTTLNATAADEILFVCPDAQISA